MSALQRLILSAIVSTSAFPGVVFSQGAADTFPSKPVTMVNFTATGGPTDIEARLYAPKLSASLNGQPFVVDYKIGAGGTVAAAYVAKAAPDGHTVLIVASAFTVLSALYKDLSFDMVKDFAHLSQMSQKPLVLIVTTSFPARNLPEYIAYARANPGKINYGMTGIGSTVHLAGAWMHGLTNTKVTYVPYKGMAPITTDMLAGRIDVTAPVLSFAVPLSKAGKVRVLAILGDKRSSLLPGVPTVAEQGIPGYNYTTWLGFSAPAATPPAIVNKLSDAFARAAKAPDVVAALEADGSVAVGSTAAEFRQVIASETERWKKVVQDNGIKLEQ